MGQTSQAAATDTTLWERVAKTSWGQYVTDLEKDLLLRAHSLAPKTGAALEDGCEGGRWSKPLSDLGWHMTCTDVNATSLNLCQQRIPQARCMLVNPADTAIPAESASFGLLLCIEVAPVIQSPWFMAEAARVLQTTGILVGVMWNKVSARGILSRASRRLFGHNGSGFYTTAYLPWRKKLRAAGFD